MWDTVFTPLDLAVILLYTFIISTIILLPVYDIIPWFKKRNTDEDIDVTDDEIKSIIDPAIWDKVVSDSDKGMLSTIRILLERSRRDIESVKQINATTIDQILALTSASVRILDEIASRSENQLQPPSEDGDDESDKSHDSMPELVESDAIIDEIDGLIDEARSDSRAVDSITSEIYE
jgi:hypothetical protein